MEIRYFKNVDTGVVKTMQEWDIAEVRFLTENYEENRNLEQDENESLVDYINNAFSQGSGYHDLVKCDEEGNPIDFLVG